MQKNYLKNKISGFLNFDAVRVSSVKVTANEEGFALFVAVTLVSVLLIVVFAVSNFAYKQLQLSSLGKDSILSFYAAESGMECARYFDNNGDYFSTTTARFHATTTLSAEIPYSSYDTTRTPPLACGSLNPTLASVEVDSPSFVYYATTTLHVYYGNDIDGPCAKIIVSKSYLDDSSLSISNGQKTIITSRGYNICNPDNPRRRTERAIQFVYWR